MTRTIILAGLLLMWLSQAAAASTFSLLFVEQNGASITPTNVISAAPGDSLKVVIQLDIDAAGVAGYSVSLQWDTDLIDEIDLISAIDAPPSPFTSGFPGIGSITESTLSLLVGQVSSFDGASIGPGPTSTTVTLGTAIFAATLNVRSDGEDIIVGYFDPVNDGCTNNAGGSCSTFLGASINAIPEPAAATLVVAGLLWLAGRAGRRASSSLS